MNIIRKRKYSIGEYRLLKEGLEDVVYNLKCGCEGCKKCKYRKLCVDLLDTIDYLWKKESINDERQW